LGLRRIVWQANYLNQGSVRLAQRMGFLTEGILRWDRVLPLGKPADTGNGKPEREGDPRAGCMGRDTIILGLCWDDWENGGREKVESEMARRK
jgi:RimJ/RimL family protein N-acetyltransferase